MKQPAPKPDPDPTAERPPRRRKQTPDQERRLFELTSLLQANRAFDNVLSPEQLHAAFTGIVQEKFGVDVYALLLLSEEADRFHVVRAAGLPEPAAAGFSFPRREGLLWQTLLQGAPFAVVDSRGNPRFDVPHRDFNLGALRASVFVPLVHQGKALGFLSLGARRGGAPYSDRDLEMLRALAEHAAVSLNTALLYAKNERARSELARTVRCLSMLYDVGRAMIRVSDLKNLLKLILAEAVRSINAQKGSLMLFDESVGRLTVRVVKGLPDPRLEEAINAGDVACSTFAPGEGVAGQVFADRKPIILNAAEQDARYASRDGSNVDSILCVPLVASDEAIGVINITNKRDRAGFIDDDLQLLSALANQAAVAINSATLHELAVTDELTKIYVRRFFNVRMDAEVRRSFRYGRPMSVALCDLDLFKGVNDTYGHAVGDAALIAVAAVFRKGLRDVDTPARYGGEEFALLLPETNAEGALAVAERLRAAVSVVEVPGLPRRLTVSIGVASLPEHGSDRKKLLAAADKALYQGKKSGRNCVCLYRPEMESG